MKSAEWDAVVRPMIEAREDWIRGMVAVVNAFGWGHWDIAELVPGERLSIRIENAYEACGYLRDYGTSERSRCYLATGGVAGLMNLLYVGDITARPDLTEESYFELFRGSERFSAEEIRCFSMGHSHCEIVAQR